MENFRVCSYISLKFKKKQKAEAGGTAGKTCWWHCSMCGYFPSTGIALWSANFRMQSLEVGPTSLWVASHNANY